MLITLITILAAALILYAVIMSGAGKKPRHYTRNAPSSRGYRGHLDQSEIRVRWDTIMATSKTGASGLKSAINEADKLFDHVLKTLGLPGTTMGDRLKAARASFTDFSLYDGVWRAHKLRNSLAHELGFDLVPSQAQEALHDFERGLRHLGAIR